MEYYLECKKKGLPFSTIPTGLAISIEHPWLAASPDGLMYDPAEGPYAVRSVLLYEADIKTKGFCLQYNSIMDKIQS